jgi:hypothetical protein
MITLCRPLMISLAKTPLRSAETREIKRRGSYCCSTITRFSRICNEVCGELCRRKEGAPGEGGRCSADAYLIHPFSVSIHIQNRDDMLPAELPAEATLQNILPIDAPE